MGADFLRDFGNLLERKMAYAKQVRNIAALQLGNQIIEDTPVDTGALRGSWKSALGAPSQDTEECVDETGEIPKSYLALAVKEWPEEGSLFMTNNQRYAEGVEFDSWSVQKPAGMVRVNIAGRTDFADLTTGTGRTE